MKLYIAEKPDVAAAIAEAMGGGFSKRTGYYERGDTVITYCIGHLLMLFTPEDHNPNYKVWRLQDLPMQLLPVQYKPILASAGQLKIVLSLIHKAEEIIHAGDPDGEGQLLVDEVLECAKSQKRVWRLLINDNNPKVIQKALQHMQPNSEFLGLSNAAKARSIADQIYGLNLTRAYTLAAQAKGGQDILSVGRVQTPVLGMIVRRCRLHESHQKSAYFTVAATFQPGIKAYLLAAEPMPLDEHGRLISQEFADSIANACRGQKAEVIFSKKEPKLEQAPLPHHLLSLQAEAHRLYGIKPHDTLSITQRLRDKYKLITYNRSDSQYLSDEQHADADSILAAIALKDPYLLTMCQKADPRHKSRAFNSAKVTAHHAIVPTLAPVSLDVLSDNETHVYLLIARAYIAQFLAPFSYESTTVHIACGGYTFSATSRRIIDKGWRAFIKPEDDETAAHEDHHDENKDLSEIIDQGSITCDAVNIARKQTKAIPRYTYETLLKDMTRVSTYVTDPKIKALLLDKDRDKAGEHGGIGTPATRSDIIRLLFERGFLVEKKGQIVSTEAARKFYDALPDSARLFDLTALWHEQQKMIERGELAVDDFLQDTLQHVCREIDRIKKDGIAIQFDQHKCPDCQLGHLQRRRGPKGIFWACKGSDCKSTFDDKAGKPDLAKATSTTFKCGACGKGLRRIHHKGAHFWGCSGFPDCRQSYVDQDGKPLLNVSNDKALKGPRPSRPKPGKLSKLKRGPQANKGGARCI